jgi:hypothetical protein
MTASLNAALPRRSSETEATRRVTACVVGRAGRLLLALMWYLTP